jgi:hypothetical protein
MAYPSVDAVRRHAEQMMKPDYFFRKMTWGTRYAYVCEWHALHCGTDKRYRWLSSRGRFTADAEVHLY